MRASCPARMRRKFSLCRQRDDEKSRLARDQKRIGGSRVAGALLAHIVALPAHDQERGIETAQCIADQDRHKGFKKDLARCHDGLSMDKYTKLHHFPWYISSKT